MDRFFFPTSTRMAKPRHMGTSPSLNRSLSRLSSSSSFSSRQPNSRIHKFLIAGGLLLFAVVAFFQLHLPGAPQGPKLSPLEHGKSDKGDGAKQAWWKESVGGRDTRDLDLVTGKARSVEKSKLGRRMGAVQHVEDDAEVGSSDEDTGTGEEMGDDGDVDEDEDWDHFDVDEDDTVVEDDDDVEDMDLAVVSEMSDQDDFESVTNESDSSKKSEQEGAVKINSVVLEKGGVKKVAFVKSPGGNNVNNEKSSSSDTDQQRGKPGSYKLKHNKITKGNAVPDWVLDGESRTRQDGIPETHQKGFEKELVKSIEKRKSSFFWDHALGVRKRSLENVDSTGVGKIKNSAAINKAGDHVDGKRLTAGDREAAKVAVLQLRGFKEVVENWRERFNSDDELIDDDVQQRLEGVREIEDALLLNQDGAPEKSTHSKNFDTVLKKGEGRFDPINPANNPMLQDPDTDPGTRMTKTDKEMLMAINGGRFSGGLPYKVLLRGNIPEAVAKTDLDVDRRASAVEASSYSMQEKEKINETVLAEISDVRRSKEVHGVGGLGKFLELGSQRKEDEVQSGYYPGIGSSLSFLNFTEAFLGQESCSLNVFMTWVIPARDFTARHQRALESLFLFHRNACVVIFSDTLEFDFFKSFVKEAYKVAVVRPSLQELLADTPLDVYSAVLPKWNEKPLFHLYNTELLRFAALYRFGGIYLDMDVLVLRPMDNLRNTLGSEITANGDLRLNGAVLVFEKSSLFLKKCLEEFTRTYNETLDQYDGADLLTRVANSTIDEEGTTWTKLPHLLNVQGPFTFFPLDSSGILKFFAAPKDDIEKEEQRKLLIRISEDAITVHLWNSITSSLVTESNSLIETILRRSCLRCKNVL